VNKFSAVPFTGYDRPFIAMVHAVALRGIAAYMVAQTAALTAADAKAKAPAPAPAPAAKPPAAVTDIKSGDKKANGAVVAVPVAVSVTPPDAAEEARAMAVLSDRYEFGLRLFWRAIQQDSGASAAVSLACLNQLKESVLTTFGLVYRDQFLTLAVQNLKDHRSVSPALRILTGLLDSFPESNSARIRTTALSPYRLTTRALTQRPGVLCVLPVPLLPPPVVQAAMQRTAFAASVRSAPTAPTTSLLCRIRSDCRDCSLRTSHPTSPLDPPRVVPVPVRVRVPVSVSLLVLKRQRSSRVWTFCGLC
jgi:hypothetical protein